MISVYRDSFAEMKTLAGRRHYAPVALTWITGPEFLSEVFMQADVLQLSTTVYSALLSQ